MVKDESKIWIIGIVSIVAIVAIVLGLFGLSGSTTTTQEQPVISEEELAQVMAENMAGEASAFLCNFLAGKFGDRPWFRVWNSTNCGKGAAQAYCFDSDGNNTYNRGWINFTIGRTSRIQYDSCLNTTILSEKYCVNSNPKSSIVNCNCTSGACR